VPEDRRPDWPGGEPDELRPEGRQHPEGRRLPGKEQLGEDQRRHSPVQEKVAPLDRRTDRTGHHRPPPLPDEEYALDHPPPIMPFLWASPAGAPRGLSLKSPRTAALIPDGC
jgi:hypothetical protein